MRRAIECLAIVCLAASQARATPCALTDGAAEFLITRDGKTLRAPENAPADHALTVSVAELRGAAGVVRVAAVKGANKRAVCEITPLPIRPISVPSQDADGWEVVVILDQAAAIKAGFAPPTASSDGRAKLDDYAKTESGFILNNHDLRIALDNASATLQAHESKDEEEAARIAYRTRRVLPMHHNQEKLAAIYDEAITSISVDYPVAAPGLAAISNRIVAIGFDLHQVATGHQTPAIYDDLESQLKEFLKEFPKPDMPDKPCNAAVPYNNAINPTRQTEWSFGTFAFPDPKRPSLQLEIGTTDTRSGVALPVEVWVTGISRDTKVSVEWTKTTTNRITFSQVLAAFFEIVFTGKLPAPKADKDNDGEGIEEFVEPLEHADLMVRDDTVETLAAKLALLTSSDTCEGADVKYDDPLEPLAAFHSIVSMSAPPDGTASYDVRVCATQCTADAPPIGKLSVNPHVAGGFGIIGAVGWTFSGNPTHDFEYTDFSWLPSATLAGGQQLYTLRANNKPLDGLTTSASIVYRWNGKDVDLALGGGPALTFGGKSASLTQWTAGVFIDPHCLDMFINLGIGFRLVDVPAGAFENMTVQAASAPTLIKTQDREWAFTIGVGWDLTTLIGTTGSAVSGLFGGTGKGS